MIGLLLTAFSGSRSMGLFPFMLIILIVFMLPKLCFSIVSATGWVLAIKPFGAPATYVNGAALGFALIVLCCSLYGHMRGWKHLVTTPVTLHFGQRLPQGFQGYRIAQISDLHMGTFGNDTVYVNKMVDHINSLDADIIVFTGDIVNGEAAELEPFRSALGRLHARDGVLSVLGNHDYCMYAPSGNSPEQMRKNLESLMEIEKTAGFDLLMNEHRIISRGADSIAIVGVENVGMPPFPENGDLGKASAGLSDQMFKVLLSHDPTHWKREVTGTATDLMLAGHTHAMQFKVFGWSPSAFAYKEWGGLYKETVPDAVVKEHQLYVCTGTGGNLPFRFGAWPEVVLITLDR